MYICKNKYFLASLFFLEAFSCFSLYLLLFKPFGKPIGIELQ